MKLHDVAQDDEPFPFVSGKARRQRYRQNIPMILGLQAVFDSQNNAIVTFPFPGGLEVQYIARVRDLSFTGPRFSILTTPLELTKGMKLGDTVQFIIPRENGVVNFELNTQYEIRINGENRFGGYYTMQAAERATPTSNAVLS